MKKYYTCYPSFEDVIGLDGYSKEDRVLIYENIITSQGPATAMEFALFIVEVLCGEDVYVEVKNQLLY